MSRGMERTIATGGRLSGSVAPELGGETSTELDQPDRFDHFTAWVADSIQSIWTRLGWVGMVSSVLVVVLATELGGWSARAPGVVAAAAAAGIAFALEVAAEGIERVAAEIREHHALRGIRKLCLDAVRHIAAGGGGKARHLPPGRRHQVARRWW